MSRLAAGALVVLVACQSDEEQLPGERVAGEPQQTSLAPPASHPPNPFVTETGIRVPILSDFELGWPRVVPTREAEGYVSVRDGAVVEVGTGFPASEVSIGESVYHSDNRQYSGSTAHTVPAYRDDAGKLIGEWRRCELDPEPGLTCQGDGYAWVQSGRVVFTVRQPKGAAVTKGEFVYGPDGNPLLSSVYTLTPVYRADDGRLLYGWPACTEASPG